MTDARDLGKLLYETEGAVARITLNWPEKANSQSSDMVHQLPLCQPDVRQFELLIR